MVPEPGQGAADVQRDLGAPGAQLPHPCRQGRPCPRPHTWAGGPPTSGEAGEPAGRRATLPGALARLPAGRQQGLSESVQTSLDQGPPWPHGAVFITSSRSREGVSRGPGLLQSKVFLRPPGRRLPRPSLAPGSARIQGLAAQLSRGRRPPSRAGLGGIPPRPGPACDFSRAATMMPCCPALPWVLPLGLLAATPSPQESGWPGAQRSGPQERPAFLKPHRVTCPQAGDGRGDQLASQSPLGRGVRAGGFSRSA